MDSVEKAERLVGWACKFSLMDLQREIVLMIHALKREQEQERLFLKEFSSFQPLRQVIILIAQIQQSRESKTNLYPHTLKEHQKSEGKLKDRVN